MKFKEFAHRTCEGSSIHGLAYLTKRELHWSERLFWAFVIVLAAYSSITICWNQWQRYKENPIVYTLQLARYGTRFPYNGLTMCANYENRDLFAQLIETLWNCNRNCADFEYFWQFLRTVNRLRYDRLHTLQPYRNDTRLKKFNFLEALKLLHEPLLNELSRPLTEDEVDNKKLLFAPSIQEAGLCQSTSLLSKYTNPYKHKKPLSVQNVMNCTSHISCNVNIVPNFMDTTEIRVYSHSVDDIVSPNHANTVSNIIGNTTLATILLNIEWTSAEDSVRDLPISFRKCRYKDENNLKYFDVYAIGLCIMECRIDAAVKLCDCKPYFYMMAPHLATCNIDGLLCLAAKKWATTTCHCLPLCESVHYVQLQSGDFESGSFSPSVTFTLTIPQLAVHRRVVFSSDQLLVSFGGAISLFLGMSFISVYGLIYYLVAFICTKLLRAHSAWRHRKYRSGTTLTI